MSWKQSVCVSCFPATIFLGCDWSQWLNYVGFHDDTSAVHLGVWCIGSSALEKWSYYSLKNKKQRHSGKILGRVWECMGSHVSLTCWTVVIPLKAQGSATLFGTPWDTSCLLKHSLYFLASEFLNSLFAHISRRLTQYLEFLIIINYGQCNQHQARTHCECLHAVLRYDQMYYSVLHKLFRTQTAQQRLLGICSDLSSSILCPSSCVFPGGTRPSTSPFFKAPAHLGVE